MDNSDLPALLTDKAVFILLISHLHFMLLDKSFDYLGSFWVNQVMKYKDFVLNLWRILEYVRSKVIFVMWSTAVYVYGNRKKSRLQINIDGSF